MKKKILSCLLIGCILLTALPVMSLPLFAEEAAVSPFERDVDLSALPGSDAWYEGQLTDAVYKNFGKDTKYAEYIEAFNAIFDKKNPSYADMVDTNATFLHGYVNRIDLGASSTFDESKFSRVDLIKNQDSAGEHVFSYILDPTKEKGYTGPDDLPKLILVTGTQGDEKGAIFGTYCFIRDIIENGNDPENEILYYYRHHVKLIVVPCLTPYGMNNNTYWNANGVNISRNYASQWKYYKFYNAGDPYEAPMDVYNNQITQYAGEKPFDQKESQIAKKLVEANPDAFFLVDYHTYTCGHLPAGDYQHINWISIADSEEAYSSRIETAAATQFEKVTAHFKEEFPQHIPQDVTCGVMTRGGIGTLKDWTYDQGILAVTMEGFCGFNKDTFCGRDTKKANSELIGNWMYNVLCEYAKEQAYPETYTSCFEPLGDNFPVAKDIDKDIRQKYVLDSYRVGEKFPLSTTGAWQVGYKTPVDGGDTWQEDGRHFAPYTYASVSAANTLMMTDASGSAWSGKGGMYITGGNVGYLMVSGASDLTSTRKGDAKYTADATVRYTVEYDGYLHIDITDLSFFAMYTSLLVVHNGTVIGRVDADRQTADYQVNSAGKWSYVGNSTTGTASFQVAAAAGDTIDFVSFCDRKNNAADCAELGIKVFNSDRTRHGIDSFCYAVSYYKENGRPFQPVTAVDATGAIQLNTIYPKGTAMKKIMEELPDDFRATGFAYAGNFYTAQANVVTLPAVSGVPVAIHAYNGEAPDLVLRLGQTLTLETYLPDNGAVAAGVRVNGMTVPGTRTAAGKWKVTVAKIDPHELLDISYTVTPYYTYKNATQTGAETTVSPVDLLQAYENDGDAAERALAKSTRLYAEAARAYFGGAELSAATKTALQAADQDLASFNQTLSYAVDLQDAYGFVSATLSLQDSVQIVLRLAALQIKVPDLANCLVKVTVGETVTYVDTFSTVTVDGKEVPVVILTGLTPSDITQDVHIMVVDAVGNPLSGELTYSVAAYCARQFVVGEDSACNDLLRALYLLGKTADTVA